MRLRTIRPGDTVECEIRGARFTALVRARNERSLTVDVTDRRQLPRGLFIDRVTARQVVRRTRTGVGT